LKTSAISAGVVADANVLLSAAIGKAALRIFSEYSIPVHVTQFNADEVEEYLPRLSSKYGIPFELLQLQWKILPLRVHSSESYAKHFESARARLISRDPDDAHPLALALSLSLPLWSNDSDLAEVGVDWYTTARLLKILSIPSGLT
jgi:predicted nucleic acid-binding protein